MFQNYFNNSTPNYTTGTRNRMEKRPSNVITITPEMAQDWLAHSKTVNRPHNERTIEKYSRIMKRGEWKINPSTPLSFTKADNLVNGHHRLLAVIRAGIPVQMAVVWDAEEDDFNVIDTGKNRSLGEMFAIEQIPNYKGVSSIVNHYVILASGRTLSMTGEKGSGLTLDLAQDYLDEYYSSEQLYQETFNLCKRLINGHVKMLTSSDMGGIMIYLIKQKGHNKQKVQDFFDALYNGGGTYPYLQDLSSTLNNDLLADKRMKAARRQSLVARAWNMFLHDSKARKVRVHIGEIVDFE